MGLFITLLILAAIVFVVWLIFKIRAIPKFGNMTLVTGAIKTGKTTLTTYLAIRCYKRQVLKYKIKRLFGIECERPLLYSNVPLYDIEYVPITKEMLLRQERPNYGSVALCQESSLIANSQSFKDDNVNEQLLLFNKLWGHETHGGYLFYDTQSVSDNHYAIKRCLNSYIHIYRTIKIPLFPWLFCWYRIQEYSDDGNVINTKEMGDKLTDNYDLCLVPKSVWKKFNCYCFDVYTNDCPKSVDLQYNGKKKYSDVVVTSIPSFVKYKNLKNYNKVVSDEKDK